MRLQKGTLSGSVLAVLAAAQIFSAPPAAALNPSDCMPTPSTWNAALANLSGPNREGWAVSDGFFSAALNNHQTLILAGDTFYGTTTGGTTFTSGTMKRNTALVVDDRYPGCWRTLAGATNSGLFPAGPDATKDWFWPGTPATSGTTVAVPLAHMGTRVGLHLLAPKSLYGTIDAK